MGLLAEYELCFEHLPLVEVAAALPEATLTVEVGQPNQGGPPPFDVDIAGETEDAIEDAFDRAAFVERYSHIEGGDGRHRYRITPSATMDEQIGGHVDRPERLHELADNDSIVDYVEVTPEGWRQQRWFADRSAFERYCEFWRRNADAFRLRRLREADGFGPTPANGLTDRQREALAAAHEMGYFEVPRRSSLGDVADALDISASSLSERLRRAQSSLVESALDEAERDGRPLKGPQS
ncbi:helix-turn-helix domain-containing protein [Natronomonas halophila]|uniref:helix-turn-helix domain-containing protein n=1 Tax=Natronomonas halophila TaxID=2747817 RepID=UPI0015B60C38|nr:helix-turn-helix domain-containing protein [Natronomonas halophila]QLD87016.1 helix-turn-helix domain-containing protein [Natronomonas halophila]